MKKLIKHSLQITIYCIILTVSYTVTNIYAQLVTNGSFENTDTGSVSGTDIEGWVLEVASGLSIDPEFTIVDESVQHGNRTMEVVVHSVGSNPWDIQLVADSIPVEPGKAYRYSIWAKAETPGAQVNCTVGNYAFNEYGAIRPANLATDWQLITFEFEITDQETFARAPIHFSLAANTGNTIYIDNLRIVNINEARSPITVESDSGEIGNDFAILQDGDITYVSVQTDFINTQYPGSSDRIISYEASFPDTGTYNFFVRIRVGTNTYNDDSFFYGNGFGVKLVDNSDDWITVNGLQDAGFSDSNSVVHDPGGLNEGIWKWVNLSNNSYQGEQGITFDVEEDSLTRTFQIGGREDGLDIDKFAFGRAELFYTVGHLDNEEPGLDDLPGDIWEGPPLASGQPKFVGSAYSPNQAPNLESYWNQITPENSGKWGVVEGQRDNMNWAGLNTSYNLAKDNGFPFNLHVLIWGNQQPAWIEDLPTAEQLVEIEEWFQAVADQYPDIDYLQVVNEPLHDPPAGAGNGNYIDALGGNGITGWDWILNSFRMAREIFPDSTKLMINDYNIVNSDQNTRQYLEIIRLLQTEDLIDGIGVQGHSFSISTSSETTMRRNLDSLALTGLPIQVTEMDINNADDQNQLIIYQRAFPVFYEHPGVEGITLWGWRPGTWQPDAYLLNQDGSERPALQWLRDYLDTVTIVTSAEIGEEVAEDYHLYNNFPNPFNPTTTIKYYLPEQSDVKVTIYNVLGMEVANLVNTFQHAGEYNIVWEGRDNQNNSVSSGVYFYRLEAGNFVEVKKLMLMK